MGLWFVNLAVVQPDGLAVVEPSKLCKRLRREPCCKRKARYI